MGKLIASGERRVKHTKRLFDHGKKKLGFNICR